MKKLIGMFMLPMCLTSCLNYVDEDVPHYVKIDENPCVRAHHGYRYKLCDDFTVNVDNDLVTVPEGFDTDFASIPQVFWVSIAPHHAKLVGPSILHDYLYRCPDNLSRKYADDVFYSGLISQGVPHGNALKMYYAVRYAGAPFFNQGMKCDNEKVTIALVKKIEQQQAEIDSQQAEIDEYQQLYQGDDGTENEPHKPDEGEAES